MKKTLIVIVLILFASSLSIGKTTSVLRDTEEVIGNTLKAGTWDLGPPCAIPTPSVAPSATLSLSPDETEISFEVTNILGYTHLSYVLTYDTASAPQGIVGSTDISCQDHYSQNDIPVGSCTTGGVCTYHVDPHNFSLTVTLTQGTDIATASASL